MQSPVAHIIQQRIVTHPSVCQKTQASIRKQAWDKEGQGKGSTKKQNKTR